MLSTPDLETTKQPSIPFGKTDLPERKAQAQHMPSLLQAGVLTPHLQGSRMGRLPEYEIAWGFFVQRLFTLATVDGM